MVVVRKKGLKTCNIKIKQDMEGSFTDNADKYCVIIVMVIYSKLAMSPYRAGLYEQLSKLCPFHSDYFH